MTTRKWRILYFCLFALLVANTIRLLLTTLPQLSELFLFDEGSFDAPDVQRQSNENHKSHKRNLLDQVIYPAVSKLRRNSYVNRVPCDQDVVEVLGRNAWKGGRDDMVPTIYENHTMKPAYTCGEVSVWTNPYLWEAHQKVILFDRMQASGLKNCNFVGLDLGGARGDWVIAAGVEANRSQYVVVEANPTLFRKMEKDFDTNAGLPGRVFAYSAAAKSDASFFGYYSDNENDHSSSQEWDGPTMCIDASSNEGVMDTAGKETSNSCSETETTVPVVTVDIIMNDFWTSTASSISRDKNTHQHPLSRSNSITTAFHDDDDTIVSKAGNLFFAKLDIEGSEYEALLGAKSVFSSKETRPCYVYIEIKSSSVNPAYDKAFHMMKDTYGYTDFYDIDSGLVGNDSYPPIGKAYENEANYEFRLPTSELEECITRVRKHTSCSSSSR